MKYFELCNEFYILRKISKHKNYFLICEYNKN